MFILYYFCVIMIDDKNILATYLFSISLLYITDAEVNNEDKQKKRYSYAYEELRKKKIPILVIQSTIYRWH